MITGLMCCGALFSTGSTAFGTSWLDRAKSLVDSVSEKDTQGALSSEDITAGLKEALRVGSENVVNQLGQTDGFNMDEMIHIPLPDRLGQAKTFLDKAGMGFLMDDLELKLNRAAEAAAPRARTLFFDAISQMTFEDVTNIYNGPDDAATQYFKEKMSPALSMEMAPVVDQALSEVGAVRAYDNMMSRYESIPFVPNVSADLKQYVVQKGMDGIFYYIAKEEAAIRQNPAKRTTELLKKVFNR